MISLTRRPRIVWQYGHYDVPGKAPGYLAHPDDAYLVADGQVQVADIINCRVLWLNHSKHIVRALGTPGDCNHDPPFSLSAPNGDTPLADGGVLVTEIGDVLVAAYDTPGRIDIISPHGRILWTCGPPSGPGALAQPSLAVELPNGTIAVTDDWHPASWSSTAGRNRSSGSTDMTECLDQHPDI